MPPLKNVRRERFAVNLAAGIPPTEAHRLAGYGNHGSNACTLRQKPDVAARVKELQKASAKLVTKDVAKKTIMEQDERKERLSELARGRIVDFIDDNGEPVLTKDSPNNGAVAEYIFKRRQTKFGETVEKSIKLHAPVPPLAELNKMDGSYAPDKSLALLRGEITLRIVEDEE